MSVDFNSIRVEGLRIVVPSARFSLSTTTTIFAVSFTIFTVSTMTQYGTIHARRVR